VLTDVPTPISDYGTPDARPVQAIGTGALSAMTFPAGSMGPKVEACIRFATATGHPAGARVTVLSAVNAAAMPAEAVVSALITPPEAPSRTGGALR
jgi:carbamate kinase